MKRVIVHHDTVLELLQDKLRSQHGTTTIIICSTKKQFLEQLIPILSAYRPAQSATLNDSVDSEAEAEAEKRQESVHPHPLLNPTLHMIATSRAIRLEFCSTINTLRAYLSIFIARVEANPFPPASLLIVDLILLHYATSEFSVQGLMRSLASAVEAAARNHVDLQLCECMDIHDLQNPDRGTRLWDAQVPLLSGSVRLRGEDAGWSGRMVAVRSIAGRWFEFENKERPRDDEINDEGEEAESEREELLV
jgi:hypothetical protein